MNRWLTEEEKRGGWRRREEQIHHSCKYISEPEEAKQTGRVSGVKGQQVGRCISVHVETGLQFSLNNLYNRMNGRSQTS